MFGLGNMDLVALIKQYNWIISTMLAVFAILQTWRIWYLTKKDKRNRNLSFYYRIVKHIKLNDLPQDFSINYNNEKFRNLKCRKDNITQQNEKQKYRIIKYELINS